jgi:glycerol-3-phosphate dehydrogenase
LVKRDFSLLADKQFDLLVCGGGIYGAWTAYDAALRGLSVAIVEQGDWAGATSSASSKLIHGGLRYLETYDFKLVRKAIRERQRLLQLAPHRVWPLRFGVPVYNDSRIGMLRLKAGLTLYDFLAGFPGEEIAHRRFGLSGFSERFPFLADTGLKGGFTYGDAQTDDARLVLELIDGATEAGAVCVNYCQLTGLIEAGGQAHAAAVLDKTNQQRLQIPARQIVYTNGQWMSASQPGQEWCRLSKGVHIVMPGTLSDEALLLTAKSDGRVFFMIPWYGMTLVGTTDNDYSGEPGPIPVEPADVAYLLAAANHYLSTAWTEQDIVGSYAGVRVMKRSDKASPSEVSRDWELKTSNNGVHYSVGGKLTSAREDAACIVDTVCRQLGVVMTCLTGVRRLPWAPETDFAAWSAGVDAQAERLGIDGECAKWLMRRHGKRIGGIFRSLEGNPSLADRIVPSLPLIYADLHFCAHTEMIVQLEDLLRRRMPLSILARLSESTMQRISEIIASTRDGEDTEPIAESD